MKDGVRANKNDRIVLLSEENVTDKTISPLVNYYYYAVYLMRQIIIQTTSDCFYFAVYDKIATYNLIITVDTKNRVYDCQGARPLIGKNANTPHISIIKDFVTCDFQEPRSLPIGERKSMGVARLLKTRKSSQG